MRIRPASNDQLLSYHHLHDHCDLLPRYVKLQRPQKPTIGKRKEREIDEESEGAETDPDMPELSDESEDDELRNLDLIVRDSDDGATVEEDQPKPHPISHRETKFRATSS